MYILKICFGTEWYTCKTTGESIRSESSRHNTRRRTKHVSTFQGCSSVPIRNRHYTILAYSFQHNHYGRVVLVTTFPSTRGPRVRSALSDRSLLASSTQQWATPFTLLITKPFTAENDIPHKFRVMYTYQVCTSVVTKNWERKILNEF